MNERIRELVEQAGGYVSLSYEHDGKLILSGEDIVKKFAELIVQECAEQIKTHNISASSEGYGDYEIGFNVGLFHALRTTKEHFGVEE